MIKIVDCIKTTISDSGVRTAFAVLACDSSSELVGVNNVDGFDLSLGSLTIVAKEGEVCTLDSEGKWHTSDGTEVTADE